MSANASARWDADVLGRRRKRKSVENCNIVCAVATNTISLRPVGSVALTDLIGMQPGNGDGVPYPFWRTKREPYWGAVETQLPPFPDRFRGDLTPLREWVATWLKADIWVECRAHAFSPGVSDVRLLAHRAGEVGFIATQQAKADAIDVYRLSPLDLGAAVAGLAKLARPGTRQAIALPGYLDNFIDNATNADAAAAVAEFDNDYGFSIRESVGVRTNAPILNNDDVVLMGTVQSRCEPSATGRVDWSRDVVVWVRINGDGDYVYTADRSQAVPLSAQTLRQKVDKLIAADVALLRQRRGIT